MNESSRAKSVIAAILLTGSVSLAKTAQHHPLEQAHAMAVPQELPFLTLQADRDESYKSLVRAVRHPLRTFFVSLQKLGLAQGLFQTRSEKSFYPEMLFSRLNTLPGKAVANCEAVFCKDEALQARLNEEIKNGRLVLVTSSLNGFLAAVPTESEETKLIKESLNKGDSPKNILIVTPKTMMSTLAHELTHAQDNDGQTLLPLLQLTQTYFDQGVLSAKSGQRINQFVGEVRAYDNEMKDLLKHSRSKEFVADRDETRRKEFALRVQQIDRLDFLPRRIREIDWKVREYYLPELLGALRDEKLTAENKSALLEQIKTLMPNGGPYSFEHLVKPQI